MKMLKRSISHASSQNSGNLEDALEKARKNLKKIEKEVKQVLPESGVPVCLRFFTVSLPSIPEFPLPVL